MFLASDFVLKTEQLLSISIYTVKQGKNLVLQLLLYSLSMISSNALTTLVGFVDPSHFSKTCSAKLLPCNCLSLAFCHFISLYLYLSFHSPSSSSECAEVHLSPNRHFCSLRRARRMIVICLFYEPLNHHLTIWPTHETNNWDFWTILKWIICSCCVHILHNWNTFHPGSTCLSLSTVVCLVLHK